MDEIEAERDSAEPRKNCRRQKPLRRPPKRGTNDNERHSDKSYRPSSGGNRRPRNQGEDQPIADREGAADDCHDEPGQIAPTPIRDSSGQRLHTAPVCAEGSSDRKHWQVHQDGKPDDIAQGRQCNSAYELGSKTEIPGSVDVHGKKEGEQDLPLEGPERTDCP